MATLQKIRTHGVLLLIVIGLGLFAFIAGDAWKILAPHQSQNVGNIAGEKVSALDFQNLFEEYTEVFKFMRGEAALDEQQSDMIKDEVWANLVNNKLVEKEAKKLGLQVTDEELQQVINEGTHPMLMNTPFNNPQTGRFDKDLLNMFLANYAKNKNAGDTYSQQLYKYWSFIQKTIRQNLLGQKYQTLLANAMLSNPYEAKAAYAGASNQVDLLMAAIPYNTVADSTVVITEAELKAAYDKKKEQFRQYAETRDIRYIDVQVLASDSDRAVIQREMDEYTEQLRGNVDNYATFVRATGSEAPYADLFKTKNALPEDVVARLDSVAIGDVFGPYYNVMDNSLNAFKKLAVSQEPDSVEFRQIYVVNNDLNARKALADSIYTALKGGASFEEVAKRYGQEGTKTWVTSNQYETANLDEANLNYLKAVTTTPANQLTNLDLATANVILEVTNRKAFTPKYKVAVVKRAVEFSKETYNEAYNNFSQFVASNNTLEKMEANAEEAGYRILSKNDMSSAEHNIGGIRGTQTLIRWAFGASKGEVSELKECGENDQLMVAALAGIHPEGYRSLKSVERDLRTELLRDKKAELIKKQLQAAGANTVEKVAQQTGAVTDSINLVSFPAAAYVSALQRSEPAVSAYASVAEVGKVSQPIKGNGGVYVLQAVAKNKAEKEYDEKAEMDDVKYGYANMVGRTFLSDLYLKAGVKDKRYLFF